MIRILEENEFFIVLSKPYQVSVHNQSPSLVEYLNLHKKPLHFVNRLDQETSGLMIIAQKPELHIELSASLEQGTKIYRALLCGAWKKPEKNFQANWPLTDQAEGHKNPQGISAHRKESVTKYQVLRSNQYFTEVSVEIKSGRQHQIRKHSALMGQAIVGDSRYGNPKYNLKIAELYKNNRMHLHAEKIQFKFEDKDYIFEEIYNLDSFF